MTATGFLGMPATCQKKRRALRSPVVPAALRGSARCPPSCPRSRGTNKRQDSCIPEVLLHAKAPVLTFQEALLLRALCCVLVWPPVFGSGSCDTLPR